MDNTKKVWINAIFLVVTLFINALGVLGLINGLSQKEISNMYLTLITPDPATFSIWSVIYVLLLISIIVMIIKKDDSYYQRAIDQITVLFRISCVFNCAWIIAFSYVRIELSVLLIIGLVVTLSLICEKLRKIQQGKRFLLALCFGIYTGWLLIAAVVNMAVSLEKLKWNSFGFANETWAIIMLASSVILIFVLLLRNRNAVFPLPVAWGYLGIYRFLKSPEGFNGEFGLLQIISLVGMFILISMAFIQLYKNHFTLLLDVSDSDKVYQ